jgi:mono/diheme cytochrome c family protein
MRVRFLTAVSGTVALLAAAAPGAQAPAGDVPTFNKDVAPIFYKKCVSCHRPGDIGPMSLLTWANARPYVRAIRTRVTAGTMPPWHADGPEGTFTNDRRLTEAERATVLKWAENGAPKGNDADLVPPPAFVQGWSIGKPDVVLSMDQEFEVKASGEIAYQYFEIPTNFTEDKWVQAIELRPGALSVVHHILAFSRDPAATSRPTPAFTQKLVGPVAPPRGGRGQNQSDPERPAGSPRPNAGMLIATTAPGTNAQVFAPGRALLIKAGSIVTFQVHYTARGEAVKDRSSIGFVFAKQPPAQEVRAGAFVNAVFAIPAGATNHKVDSAIEFTQDAQILALFPHTHLRGKKWEYRMVYPDGRSEVVLSVPKYDFNWQTYYEFARPLAAPKGSRLEASAWYDNSAANKANPDPKIEVRWGEQTWEEMQYSGITYVVDEPKATTAGQP